MKISERIRQLRVHKKMTQGELADGISSVAYLSRIENNQIHPSSRFLKNISKKLGVELEYLVTLDSVKYRDKINGIVTGYRKTGELSEVDAMFLNMHAVELHDDHIHVRIYSTLISYYVDRKDAKEARKLYEMSRTFVPEAGAEEQGEDYFYYYVSSGSLFFYLQDFFQSNHYYAKAEKYIGSVGCFDAARLYYNISLVKQRIVEDKSVCLLYSQKAHDYFKSVNDRERLARVLITQGVQCNLLNRYDRSMKYLNEALEIVGNNGDLQLLAMIECSFGRIHQCLQDYGTAIRHFENSIALNKSISFVTENVYGYKRLVEIYMELKVWSTADRYLDQALQIAKEHQLHYEYIELCAIKAGAHKLRADEAKYEKEMQKAVALCIMNNQLSHVKPLASELGAHFYEKRAYKKSADYYTLALEYDHKVGQLNKSSISVIEGAAHKQPSVRGITIPYL